MSELEKCVQMVLDAGLATGHAESMSDLLAEVLSQVEELRDRLSAEGKERTLEQELVHQCRTHGRHFRFSWTESIADFETEETRPAGFIVRIVDQKAPISCGGGFLVTEEELEDGALDRLVGRLQEFDALVARTPLDEEEPFVYGFGRAK